MTKSKKTIDVSGMSISDIMGMDIREFNRLKESDLRAVTSRLVSAGNKRVRRLQSKHISSPALAKLGTDVRFSTKLPKGTPKEQRVNLLRQEFSRVRNFIASKTSTISGHKKFIRESYQRLSQDTGQSISDLKRIDLGKVYEMLHKLQESNPSIRPGTDGSSQVRNYIIEQIIKNPEISEQQLFARATKLSEKIYNDTNDETEEIEFYDI